MPEADLVLGLLDKGGVGIGVLAVIGLGYVIRQLTNRRISLMAGLRADLIAAKAENRELEAELDQERTRRRKAEDELWDYQHGRARRDQGRGKAR